MGKHSDGDDTERLFVSYYTAKHGGGEEETTVELDADTVEIPGLAEEHQGIFGRVVSGAISLIILIILAVIAVVVVLIGAWVLLFALSLIKELLVVVILAVLLLVWLTRGT